MGNFVLKIGMLSVTFFSSLILVGCDGGNPQKTLIGQWEIVNSNVDRDLLADKMEFINDGTGLLEAKNIRGIGPWAESFTWRIDNDGRLIITSPNGVAQIYSTVEISKSTLILAGNIPVVGNIRTTYSRPKKGATSVQQTKKTKPKPHSSQGKPFTDSRDKKKYRTVKIGELTWMAENLNFVTDNSWCYGNDDANCAIHGRLYTWNDAMKACPAGWRLPDDVDWNDLIEAAGGQNAIGERLKVKPQQWDGTDNFGFSALSSGYRSNDGRFTSLGEVGHWWNARTNGSHWGIYSNSADMRKDCGGLSNERDAYSVRCVRGPVTLSTIIHRGIGGIVTPDSGQKHEVGKSIKISATPDSCHTFLNWIMMDSSKAKIADVNSATTTVTLSSNARIAVAFIMNPGNQFNSDIAYSSFTDLRDNKSYRTVNVDGIVWMAENLNFATSSSKCSGGDDVICATYGRLYNWDDAMNVCPAGWRLPTRQEFRRLIQQAGGERIAEKNLKAKKKWFRESDDGIDKYGFSALPSGFYGQYASNGYWWSSTPGERRINFYDGSDSGRNQAYHMNITSISVSVSEISRNSDLSVRCVQE